MSVQHMSDDRTVAGRTPVGGAGLVVSDSDGSLDNSNIGVSHHAC